MRILVVEDDVATARYIYKGLLECGHAVDLASDGQEGLLIALDVSHDVIVADRMLPAMDGLTMVQKVRDAGNAVPILLLSALGEVDHRVEGLRAGGDDYLVKPFSFSELLARIEALVRRQRKEAAPAGGPLVIGDLEVDLEAHSVRRAGKRIELQPRELQILEFLMRHAGQVVTRTMLLEQIWDYHFDPQTNVVDVHISRLRRKIDKGFDTPLIRSIRGAGYMLSAD